MNQAVVARTRSSPDKKARAGAGTAGRVEAGAPADPRESPNPERRLVFVSHANPEDNPAAAWFATQLTLLGYDVWCDLKSTHGGESDFWLKVQRTIDNDAVKFVYILSNASCDFEKKRGIYKELEAEVSRSGLFGARRPFRKGRASGGVDAVSSISTTFALPPRDGDISGAVGFQCNLRLRGVSLRVPKLAEIPACPECPAARSGPLATRDYEISLLTPLFGGGVEAGVPDASMPIRGTAIRGHLQFWWRATRGARFANYKDLFKRHADIWGTTEKASPVGIEIRLIKSADPKPCAKYELGNNGRPRLSWSEPFHERRALQYALFPFQGQTGRDGTIEKQPAKFIASAKFELRIRFPESLRSDVETAVAAWVNFGGLGARTRRGCGALVCKDLAPQGAEDANLRECLDAAPIADNVLIRGWPVIGRNILVGPACDPLDAWARVIALLQTFRQGPGVGRNPGTQPNRPGRSRWPEPESIRKITIRRAPSHARIAHIPDDAFPRAEFGLPIVFHFKDQHEGEPQDTNLQPAACNGDDCERMASPLILKPLGLANGRAVPLIVRLSTPPLEGVELKETGQNGRSLARLDATAVHASRIAAYRDSPLAESQSGSALEAFLGYARGSDFREIVR